MGAAFDQTLQQTRAMGEESLTSASAPSPSSSGWDVRRQNPWTEGFGTGHFSGWPAGGSWSGAWAGPTATVTKTVLSPANSASFTTSAALVTPSSSRDTSVSSSSSTTPSSSGFSTTPSSSSTSSASIRHSRQQLPAVIGGVIGGALILAILPVIWICLMRRRRKAAMETTASRPFEFHESGTASSQQRRDTSDSTYPTTSEVTRLPVTSTSISANRTSKLGRPLASPGPPEYDDSSSTRSSMANQFRLVLQPIRPTSFPADRPPSYSPL